MTKQEEIREGIAIKLWLSFGENICPQCKSWKLCPHKKIYLDDADYLISYLHSQGVVIKVDRMLWPIDIEKHDALVQLLINNSFRQVEPLI